MTNQSNRENVKYKLINLGWISCDSDGKLWFIYSSEDFSETNHFLHQAEKILDRYGLDYTTSERVETYNEYDEYEEPIDEHRVKVATIVIHD